MVRQGDFGYWNNAEYVRLDATNIGSNAPVLRDGLGVYSKEFVDGLIGTVDTKFNVQTATNTTLQTQITANRQSISSLSNSINSVSNSLNAFKNEQYADNDAMQSGISDNAQNISELFTSVDNIEVQASAKLSISNDMYITTVQTSLWSGGGWEFGESDIFVHPSRLDLVASAYTLNVSLPLDLWTNMLFGLNAGIPVSDFGSSPAWYNSWDASKKYASQSVIVSQPTPMDDAFYFDGADDILTTPIVISNSSFTVITKFKYPTRKQMGIWTSKLSATTSGAPYSGANLQLEASGALSFSMQSGNNTGGATRTVYSQQNLETNMWYIVATVFKAGDEPSLSIYIDGVLKQEVAATNSVVINNNALTLGRYRNDVPRYFEGSIGDFIYMQRVCSDEEIMSAAQTLKGAIQ